MNDQQYWQEQNTQYLSAALAWLRLRLEHLAQHDELPQPLPAPVTPPPVQPPQRRGWFRRTPKVETAAAPPVLALPAAATTSTTNGQQGVYARQMAEAESRQDMLPALIMLSQRLQMTRFEREVLLLCIAMELDTRIAALCARAQDDASKPYPTFALALMLFDEPSWDVVSPERPLRYWHLIEINQPAGQPLTVSSLRADERIVNYVKGLSHIDNRLAALVGPLEIEETEELPPSQQLVVEQIVQAWRQSATASEARPVIQLPGADVASKYAVAYHAASVAGHLLYRIPAELLPVQAADIELFARLWQREDRLLPLALYLDMEDIDQTSANDGPALFANRFLARSDGIFFLGVREMWSHAARPSVTFDVAKPTVEEQKLAWASSLDEKADDQPGILSAQFNLNLPAINRIAAAELSEPEDTSAPLSDRLWNSCLASTRPSMDTLAQRLALKARWKDLVLPREEMDMLEQLAAQVQQRNTVYEEWGFADKMNRGLGINALFAGESGTGKTMAAEVIANSLQLNLYRIDLSAVVSKYIGETEKNLRRLFDAAEDGGAILFFDEADALFGKRSEVKDSHDRYANIEINYLLQRMEAYRGLAILATNLKSSLDTAFVRRLRFIVRFPFPGISERKRIWQNVFPTDVPLGKLDYERLARLNLTGGSIHNVALNAAFVAANAGSKVSKGDDDDKSDDDEVGKVTMELLINAARSEYRKLERPINEADFKLPVAQGAKA